MERWKIIDGFPDYEVSDDGRVRSWRKKKRNWRKPDNGRLNEPREIIGFTDRRGYRSVIFKLDNRPYRRTVHRLVAMAYIPNPHGLSDVAHNDGDPRNNHVRNLRWSTHKDNQMDMRKHGTMQDGEKCQTAKITQSDAVRIKKLAQKRGMGVKLAFEFGLSKAQISRIKNGIRWKAA